MTTAARLIEIIQRDYQPNEELVWQIIAKEHYDKDMSDEEWEARVEYVDDHTSWADDASMLARSCLDAMEENEEFEDEEDA